MLLYSCNVLAPNCFHNNKHDWYFLVVADTINNIIYKKNCEQDVKVIDVVRCDVFMVVEERTYHKTVVTQSATCCNLKLSIHIYVLWQFIVVRVTFFGMLAFEAWLLAVSCFLLQFFFSEITLLAEAKMCIWQHLANHHCGCTKKYIHKPAVLINNQ